MAYTKATLITGPTVEPITVMELRDHLLIDTHDADTYLGDLIVAARTHLEQITWRAFLSQTWDIYFDGFETELLLPKAPIISITSVKYQNTANVQTTLGATIYELAESDEAGIVREKYNQVWPITLGHADDVVVRAVCGYGTTAATVPASLRHAVKFLAGHWYKEREPVNVGNIVNPMPWTIEALIEPYRMQVFV